MSTQEINFQRGTFSQQVERLYDHIYRTMMEQPSDEEE
jgi:hypothetical protein